MEEDLASLGIHRLSEEEEVMPAPKPHRTPGQEISADADCRDASRRPGVARGAGKPLYSSPDP